MKQGLVKFSKEFITPIGLKEWVGIEYPVDFDNKDALEAFAKAESMVNEYQRSKEQIQYYPQAYGNSTPIQVIDKKTEDREIGVKPEDIMSCQDLKTLKTYRLLIKGNSELEKAYNLRRDVLVRKESQEILDKTYDYYKNLPKNK